MDNTFTNIIRKKQGAVVIIAGSGSDREHMQTIAAGLRGYGIPYEARVLSAHKQVRDDDVQKFITEYTACADCPLVIISVAGGTDALSGTLSFNLPFPVIACAPDATPDRPNLSTLTNPPGSSNVCVIRPANAARFVAQSFAHCNQAVRDKLNSEIADKMKKLRAEDKTIRDEMLYLGE